MPTSINSAGTQTCTLATNHDLATLTGPAGGAIYALVLDTNALLAGERLTAYVTREMAAGGTQRVLWRGIVANGPTSWLISESLLLRLPEGVDGVFGIRQDGGTGRDIVWSVERVDG